MGVSGCGKSTVAEGVAAATGFTFAEGDRFHPPANVAKMASGTPLTDEDRWPWLRELAAWMSRQAAADRSTVMACSALRRSYRDVLREGPPSVDFILLDGSKELILSRMRHRHGHYMPVDLLDSQFATLEPLQPDESGLVLDISASPETIIREAVDWIRAS